MNVAFLGAPGAGKGTQAVKLACRWGLPHIETGHLLREAVEEGTEVGKLARPYLQSGRLVPDEIVIGIVREKLAELNSSSGMILDGFPRTVAQAQALDGLLAKRGQRLDMLIYLVVPREALIRRLCGRLVCPECGATCSEPHDHSGPYEYVCEECGAELRSRGDDAPELIGKRIEVYLAETLPLLEYYQRKGLLREVDGHGPIERVHQDILKLVEEG